MTLPDVGINEETKFATMADAGVKEGQLETAGYIKLTPDDVVAIYKDSMTPETF